MPSSPSRHAIVALLFAGFLACAKRGAPPALTDAPIAGTEAHTETVNGVARQDPWFWLRDREDPRVMAYLEAENAWTDQWFAPLGPLRQRLYDEIVGRIQEDDQSVPYRDGDWLYFERTAAGKDYPVYARRRADDPTEEEVILDANALAKGHDFMELGAFDVSPDGKVLAYSTDTEGDERYELVFLNLTTGELYPERISGTYYSSAWANDNQTFFYTTVDDAMRPYQLHRHALGTDAAEDVVVYEEPDEAFFVEVRRTRSDAFIVLDLASQVTTEERVLSADDPTGDFTVVEPRKNGVEYRLDHHGDRFFILTNDVAVNFRLVEAPVQTPDREHWTERVGGTDDAYLEHIELSADHLALFDRQGGLQRVRVQRISDGEEHVVALPDAAGSVWPEANFEWDTSTLRIGYTSMVTPESIFDYDMEARTLSLLKEQPIRGGYDRTRYATSRTFATAPDGAQVPVTVVHSVDTPIDGTAPCVMVGYGAYGVTYDPYFSVARLSLLDRGVVYAIAAVRGGADLGRPWYEDGKLDRKKNTFTDFIAAGEHLIEAGYAAPGRLGITGGSAGGLLMGAATNMRPDLFAAVVAEVPFVDVLNTMLDPTLPLTVIEYEEWGNPNVPEYYSYIQSYSPYDNVASSDYPDMYVIGGLNDTRVSYWEPAKWVAKLRATRTDDGVLLLRTNMGAGHGGPSGRYPWIRDAADEYAFFLDRLGVEPAVRD